MRAMVILNGTNPPISVITVRSPALDIACARARASQLLPGPVCSKAKAKASSSKTAKRPPPANFSAARTERITAYSQGLERLTDADVHFDRLVAGTMREGGGEVEADGADNGIVAQADAGAPEEAHAVGKARRIDVAAFDKGGNADGVGDAVAEL